MLLKLEGRLLAKRENLVLMKNVPLHDYEDMNPLKNIPVTLEHATPEVISVKTQPSHVKKMAR